MDFSEPIVADFHRAVILQRTTPGLDKKTPASHSKAGEIQSIEDGGDNIIIVHRTNFCMNCQSRLMSRCGLIQNRQEISHSSLLVHAVAVCKAHKPQVQLIIFSFTLWK
jgi:hypothetical protein